MAFTLHLKKIDSQRGHQLSKPPKKAMKLDLRRILPDVALKMETQVILHEANSLGIKAKVNRSIKTPHILIPLTFQHSMSITPVDRGIQGFAEWFTFMPNSTSLNEYPEFTSRVYVQVFDDLIENKLVESFTIQAPNLETIIRASLSIFYSNTGKQLAPIIKDQ